MFEAKHFIELLRFSCHFKDQYDHLDINAQYTTYINIFRLQITKNEKHALYQIHLMTFLYFFVENYIKKRTIFWWGIILSQY